MAESEARCDLVVTVIEVCPWDVLAGRGRPGLGLPLLLSHARPGDRPSAQGPGQAASLRGMRVAALLFLSDDRVPPGDLLRRANPDLKEISALRAAQDAVIRLKLDDKWMSTSVVCSSTQGSTGGARTFIESTLPCPCRLASPALAFP